MHRKLYKSRRNVKVDGVCAGIGDYFNIDPTLVRIVVFVMILFSNIFPGLLAYLVAAIIIPREPADME
ncbi:MAG: PspC domain-containing protein [Defluviitaleaceae bacterium]|nr:PspC domain-containing protein [Defluviitaleaceae bacterium]